MDAGERKEKEWILRKVGVKDLLPAQYFFLQGLDGVRDGQQFRSRN